MKFMDVPKGYVVERSNDEIGFWLRKKSENRILARSYAVNENEGYNLHIISRNPFFDKPTNLGFIRNKGFAFYCLEVALADRAYEIVKADKRKRLRDKLKNIISRP